MAQTAQIIRGVRNEMTTEEFTEHFLEIIRPLDYEVSGLGDSIYLKVKDDPIDKEGGRGVRVSLGTNCPSFVINRVTQYADVFFDFLWDDERHGPESMNSDMILAITAEYMKHYPDALFHAEWYLVLDKVDIDRIASQPFDPGWFYRYQSHLHITDDEGPGDWIIDGEVSDESDR